MAIYSGRFMFAGDGSWTVYGKVFLLCECLLY